MTIYDNLIEYSEKNIYPFHMPGHKRNPEFMPKNILDCDITEIPNMDNLHKPEGIIRDAQIRAAEVFGSQESFFLINGTSGGLISAIISVLCEGDYALVARNCHRSVFSGLSLCGANPIYIMPDITDYGIPGGISPIAIEKELEKNPEISAVIITSPTYEGFVSDIKAIADIVHKKNKILIVDEAHGAHFAFSDFFPKSAIQLGADIVVQSLHKTLPVFTQASIMHINKDRIDIDKLKTSLAVTQTSSPSYIFMACADYCINMLSEDKSIFDNYRDKLIDFRDSVKNINTIKLLGRELIGKNNIYDIDLSKLVFYINSDDIDGNALDNALCADYKLQIEMASKNHIIAMTSPADTADGFSRLKNGIMEISSRLSYNPQQSQFIFRIPHMVYTPKEIFNRHFTKSSVALQKSLGMVSSSFVIPYPPGIPLLVPGEKINEITIANINWCIKNNIPLLGQEDIEKQNINIIIE